ncbi:hypothetical protein [Streptomyces melanogenes]|uniref:hypothetical protein n=1 Tax=Streptomyces melanogenes TaxID=67326 RepID=UPI0037B65949
MPTVKMAAVFCRHLAALRAGTADPIRADIPSPRKITSWIMRPRESLTGSQNKRLLEVRSVRAGIKERHQRMAFQPPGPISLRRWSVRSGDGFRMAV